MRSNSGEFIIKSKSIHKDRYDYSLVEYENAKTKVKIICSEHGIFEQTPSNHLSGYNCIKCGGKSKSNTREFIIKSKLIHKDRYDYSLVEYENTKTKVKIICPEHGTFEQLPKNHLSKSGCPKCSNCHKYSIDDIIDKSNLIHNNKYTYTDNDITTILNKITIICPDHGEFEQLASNHIHKKYGCPKCNSSKGETMIMDYLNERGIDFKYQHRFYNCRNINELSFDFYLPYYNLCIEYDGIQHFESVEFWGGESKLEYTIKCDNIKNEYCLDNNIKMFRIPYYDDCIERLGEIEF